MGEVELELLLLVVELVGLAVAAELAEDVAWPGRRESSPPTLKFWARKKAPPTIKAVATYPIGFRTIPSLGFHEAAVPV